MDFNKILYIDFYKLLNFNYSMIMNLFVTLEGIIFYNTSNFVSNTKPAVVGKEYHELIDEINIYVQKLIDEKLIAQQDILNKMENRISEEMSKKIGRTIHESLIAIGKPDINFNMNDEDLRRISEVVKDKLLSTDIKEQNIFLTQENLERISLHFKQNYALNENKNMEEIIFRILSSPQLQEIIDSNTSVKSFKEKIIENERKIKELQNEMINIKLKLEEEIFTNHALHKSINKLNENQETVNSQLNIIKENSISRNENLLSEIEAKFSELKDNQFELINKQMRSYFIEVFSYKNETKTEMINLKNWISDIFVAKEILEERLFEIMEKTKTIAKDEIERSGIIFMNNINEKIKSQINDFISQKMVDNKNNKPHKRLDIEEIKKIVKDTLAIYDADKTGMVDYALESAGGQILSTRCTETYQVKSAQISIFGLPLWYPSNTPRTAISPTVQPGDCWSFQGFPGSLVLKMSTRAIVTGFHLEHLSKRLTPTGRIDSAPKSFSVWGLDSVDDKEPILFGDYEYLDNDVPLQYFPVQNRINRVFDIIELKIDSNHGNRNYTCLYRFRVHGNTFT